MPNDAARARFWKDFILRNCGYPAHDRLREQFEAAAFTEFCECGCNSFGLAVGPGAAVPPLLPPNNEP